jgi:aspartyl aminopeptidase
VPVQDLLEYIDDSPTPFHAVAETVTRLEAHGYRPLDETEAWEVSAGAKVYVARGGGSVAAFHIGSAPAHEAGFHLIGAHTDSPNLRVKPNPELKQVGYGQLGVEPYGGVLLHTWLDRDLSLAGRVSLADGSTRLIDFGRELLRIPSLAIHLNRKVNTEGLKLNAQKHMAPVLALDGLEDMDLRALLAEELGDVKAKEIRSSTLRASTTSRAVTQGSPPSPLRKATRRSRGASFCTIMKRSVAVARREPHRTSCEAVCSASLATPARAITEPSPNRS